MRALKEERDIDALVRCPDAQEIKRVKSSKKDDLDFDSVADPENLEEAADLVEELYKLLCKACICSAPKAPFRQSASRRSSFSIRCWRSGTGIWTRTGSCERRSH
jgi:hypothetical protein